MTRLFVRNVQEQLWNHLRISLRFTYSKLSIFAFLFCLPFLMNTWIHDFFKCNKKKKKRKKNANSYITKLHKNNRKNLFYFFSYISLFGKRNNSWLVICKTTRIISVYLYKMATIHIFVTLKNIDLTKQEYYTLQVNVHIYVVSIYKYRRLPLEKYFREPL